MKKNPLTLIVGILLIVIVALLLFVFQVRQSEVAVVATFGRATRPITEPGAHIKLPWPIQKVYKLDQRVQNFASDKFSEGLTQDSFNLLTSVYVGWKITDPKAFFLKFAQNADPIAEAEKSLENLVGNAKNAVVSSHPLMDFLSPENGGNKFGAIEQEILAAVRAQVLANNYGVQIEFLGIRKLGLPEAVTQSVFALMTSERQTLISKSQYEGEAKATEIRSKAERKANEILSEANTKATQIRAEGEKEVADSLKTFQQEPELAKFLFKLNALEGSLKDRSTLIFDQNTPPFDLLKGDSTKLLNKP